MKRIFGLILLLTCLSASPLRAQSDTGQTFWLGADISGTTELEARGKRLYNKQGEIRENTALMCELGLNAVRLRVWVNPRGGWSGAEDVLRMARRAKYYGMALMIDFHYSDWWADPGKQNIPALWQYLKYDELKYKLAEHTRDVLQLLKDNQIDVKWVQVGNETRHGFLWPVGRAEDNMQQYAELTEVGYQAVKQVYPDAQVIVHIDGGMDQERYDFIFDGLRQYGTHYDMIGLSVYPYWDMEEKMSASWQETVKGFAANIRHLYEKYGKESMVVETGTPVSKPKEGKEIMAAVIKASMEDCEGHCHGVFYWAPELEGAYPLGAFQNGKPTEIMDAFTAAATKQQTKNTNKKQ